MEITCGPELTVDLESQLLAVLLYDDNELPERAAELDAALGGSLSRAIERKQVTGGTASSMVITGGESGPHHVVLVGVDNDHYSDAEAHRIAGGTIASEARAVNASDVALLPPGEDRAARAAEVVEGMLLSAYRYEPYKGFDEDEDFTHDGPDSVTVLAPDADVEQAVNAAGMLARATNWARDLANAPGNDMTPDILATAAEEMAAAHEHLSFRALDKDEIVAKEMGLLYNVGRGSEHQPRMIVLEWNPPGDDTPDDERICFVGKAVTFDTGGISIKPSAGMPAMRLDKAGGCAVIGAMRAIAELGVKRRVLAVIPAAENMPGGNAYKPGDVYSAMDGTSVEVTNTDAEGRLILADGICYARELGCNRIVELSTLTGAMAFFFGHQWAGVVAEPDADWTNEVVAAGETSGDRAWALPMDDQYKPALKSDIADLVNSGPRQGGGLYAGLFLQQFAKDTPFAHVDIAGTGMLDKPYKYYKAKGSSGYGVRLLAELASTDA